MKASVYMALNFGAQALSIAFYLVLARAISPEGYGSIMAAVSAALVGGGLLNFGSNTHFIRELSSGRFVWDDVIFRSLGRFGYSLALGALLGLIFQITIDGVNVWFGVGIAWLTVGAHLAQLAQVIPLTSRRLFVAGFALVIEKGVPFFVIFALLSWRGLTPELIPLIMSIGCFAAVTYNWIAASVVGRNASLGRLIRAAYLIAVSRNLPLVKSFINPWRGSLGIGLASISYSLRQLDVVAVRSIGGAAAAGEYAAVSRWIAPVSLVASSLGNAVLPQLSGAPTMKAAAGVLTRFWPILVMITCGALVGAAFSKQVVVFVLGNQYAESWAALTVLLVATPVAFVRQLLYILLISRRYDAICARVVVTSTAIGLCFAAVFSYFFGALGAGLAFALTEGMMFLAFLCLIFSATRDLPDV